MTDRRVVFDFEIEFANGGGIQGQDFRLDLEGPGVDDRAVADRIVADLRLLMVSAVRITNVRVIEEPHKRAIHASGMQPGPIVELSHVIRDARGSRPEPGQHVLEPRWVLTSQRRNPTVGSSPLMTDVARRSRGRVAGPVLLRSAGRPIMHRPLRSGSAASSRSTDRTA